MSQGSEEGRWETPEVTRSWQCLGNSLGVPDKTGAWSARGGLAPQWVAVMERSKRKVAPYRDVSRSASIGVISITASLA